MLGFIVRTLGCLVLAAATLFAIGDIARSLSAESLRLTTMAEAVGFLSEEPWVRAGTPDAAPAGTEQIWSVVSGWPVSPTLAAFAILVLLLARRREPRPHSL
jgi:hypothetical protein